MSFQIAALTSVPSALKSFIDLKIIAYTDVACRHQRHQFALCVEGVPSSNSPPSTLLRCGKSSTWYVEQPQLTSVRSVVNVW